MRTIALEEHFVTRSFQNAVSAFVGEAPPQIKQLEPKLLDLAEGRIAAMDEAQIDFVVLSLAASGLDKLKEAEATSLAKDINDELSSAVRARPDRLGGFATLAVQDPEGAAKEFERCISELGFVGAMLNGTCQGAFYDDPKFLPIFEVAQSLDVPIYLHPAPPPQNVFDAYYSNLPGAAGHLLSIAGWGWHSETALHTLRLIVSGLFEKLPNLKLIIGHMGEGLPYALARSSAVLSGSSSLPHSVAEYFLHNVWITTSGYFTRPPFECAREVVGIDKIMFSVDYPFSSNSLGRKFLESLALSTEELEKLCGNNAQKLLKLV